MDCNMLKVAPRYLKCNSCGCRMYFARFEYERVIDYDKPPQKIAKYRCEGYDCGSEVFVLAEPNCVAPQSEQSLEDRIAELEKIIKKLSDRIPKE